MGKSKAGMNKVGYRPDGLNEEQVTERDQKIWQLRQSGKMQKDIALIVGCSQSTVSDVLKALQKDAESELLDMVAATKLAHIARLEYIYNQSVEAWERSKTPRNIASEKTIKPNVNVGGPQGQRTITAGGGRSETSKRAESRNGDIKYLSEARAALSDIRKIIGADAPIVSITDTSSSWAESVRKAAETTLPLSSGLDGFDEPPLTVEVLE